MVDTLAASYYSHFSFSSKGGELHLSLSDSAPVQLKELVARICGPAPDQNCLSCLYECLCAIAGQEASVAPENCREDMFPRVREMLTHQAQA